MSWELHTGDCVEAMAAMDECSVDAVVCDPPYGLDFMGKDWDRLGEDRFRAADGRPMQEWHERWAAEALRVLKPGGHLLAFGGTRTYHRLACAVEDAGFEIRDCLVWLYGSGFPKSLDVGKAIDKAAGAERTVAAGVKPGHEDFVERTDAHSAGGRSDGWDRPWREDAAAVAASHVRFAPATPEAATWDGWGTALKPAHEPIVLARKPLASTVAANVLAHGTGALNVNGCRIEGEPVTTTRNTALGRMNDDGWQPTPGRYETPAGGRWPANVLLDPEAAQLLDEQTGELVSGANPTRRGSDKFRDIYGDFSGQEECVAHRGVDRGGASRFFYTAKASRAERNAGLAGLEERQSATRNSSGRRFNPICDNTGTRIQQCPCGDHRWSEDTNPKAANDHPTVKPIELMRWLCRLVTPAGGTVLDPFTGSGTTGCAAALEDFHFIGIEREPDYVAIANARIAYWTEHGPEALAIMQAREQSQRKTREVEAAGQLDLLGGEAA